MRKAILSDDVPEGDALGNYSAWSMGGDEGRSWIEERNMHQRANPLSHLANNPV